MDTKIRKELETIGLKNLGEIKQNLSPELLVEEALFNKEGVLTDTGAFRVVTGKFTGRSPEDRFIVKRESYADKIAWGKVNKSIEPEVFEDVNYDVDLLIGKWQSGPIFYRFDIDRVGVTWDVEDDILEAEASHLKWELKSSQFIHYYEMENGGVIPKFYKIKYLDLNKLIFIDEYANEFVFVKVVE